MTDLPADNPAEAARARRADGEALCLAMRAAGAPPDLAGVIAGRHHPLSHAGEPAAASLRPALLLAVPNAA